MQATPPTASTCSSELQVQKGLTGSQGPLCSSAQGPEEPGIQESWEQPLSSGQWELTHKSSLKGNNSKNICTPFPAQRTSPLPGLSSQINASRLGSCLRLCSLTAQDCIRSRMHIHSLTCCG